MPGRSSLRVDLDALGQLARDLTVVRSSMERTATEAQESEATLGSGRVRGALTDYEKRWRDKREEIDGNVEALVEMLDASVEAFTDADGQLADALTAEHSESQIGSGDGHRQVAI